MRSILIVCLLACAALAQTTPPHADAGLAEAKVHFEQGVALFGDGNYGGALAEFEAAYRLHSSPSVLYNIGLSQKALFRYADAVVSLRRYLDESKSLTEDRRQEVEGLIEEMKALMASVAVVVVPERATVVVDGHSLGASPLKTPVRLAAGGHTIEAQAPGYLNERREITVAAGQSIRVEINLTPIAASKPAQAAKVAQPIVAPAPVEVRTEPQRKPRYWIAGVVIGTVAAVALGVGLGVGLGGTSVEKPTLGTARVQ